MYVAFSRVKTPKGLFLLSKVKLFDRAKDNETDLEIKRMLKDNPLKFSFDKFESEHGLIVIYQNMRGFRTNIEHMMVYRCMADVWYSKYDILILSETNVQQLGSYLHIPNCKLLIHSLCPSNAIGKGILIYGKSNVTLSILHHQPIHFVCFHNRQASHSF